MRVHNVDTLIFDLDGTLLDTLSDLANAVNHTLIAHGKEPYELEEYKNFIGRGSKQLLKSAFNTDDDKFIEDIYNEYLEYYKAHVKDKTKAYRGIKSALTNFYNLGYHLFVLTNKPQELADKLMKSFFPSVKFDAIISSASRFKPKPDPESLLYILTTYKIDPKDAIFFGDSNYDMEIAKKCNIPYRAGCLYGYQNEEALVSSGATKILKNGYEISRYVFSLGITSGLSTLIVFDVSSLAIALSSVFLGATTEGSLAKVTYFGLFSFTMLFILISNVLILTHRYYLRANSCYFFLSAQLSSLAFSYLFIPNSTHTFSFNNKIDLAIFITAIILSFVALLALVFDLKSLIKRAKKRLLLVIVNA
ncbi:MAG TPA: hypothetical protein DCY93_00580, partial [Firmicutes bacterium]|nr:hypothetical protein [Bacillota bacterium]